MIVQLGHRADGGARSSDRAALIDGDGRRDALDAFHVRLIHAVEKLARVGGKTLDVAALTLGVQNVKRQGRFARAADAGHHRQGIEGNLDIEIFEIVLLGAADVDAFTLQRPRRDRGLL